MPYVSSTIPLPRNLDRRVKITDEDKEQMRYLHKSNMPIREIARQFEGVCSRRTIQLVIFPERLEVAKKQFAERSKDGRYRPSKEKWAGIMREHRAYKHKLHLENKI